MLGGRVSAAASGDGLVRGSAREAGRQVEQRDAAKRTTHRRVVGSGASDNAAGQLAGARSRSVGAQERVVEQEWGRRRICVGDMCLLALSVQGSGSPNSHRTHRS